MAIDIDVGTNSSLGRPSPACVQETLDIISELAVVLKQKAMRRVRVYLHAGLWNQACKQVRVMGKNHGVAVTVRHEHRQVDRAYSLQHAVIRNSPCTNGVAKNPRGAGARAA